METAEQAALKPEAAQASSAGTSSASRTYPLQEGPSDALVLYCTDPRFQEAFRTFLREELGIQNSAPIVIPGSAGSFGLQSVLPKRWNALRSQIELMAEHNKFPRVVIINHDDCKGYASVAQHLGGLARIAQEQRSHLKRLAEFILEKYLPQARFELYQAHIVEKDGKRFVQFERVL